MIQPGDLVALRQHSEVVDGCWIWQRAVNGSGYGVVRLPGREPAMVHRVAWMARNGQEIPDGFEIDHICNVRLCFNPKHLQLVDRDENVRLAVQRRAALRPPPVVKRTPSSIRVRPGPRGTKYAVLWRDSSSGKSVQSSRTFGTMAEAEAFRLTLPPVMQRAA